MENDPKSVYFILKRKNHIYIYADGKYPIFSRNLKICKTKFSLLKKSIKIGSLPVLILLIKLRLESNIAGLDNDL